MQQPADRLDPIPVFVAERRVTPDRRTVWRGGRRDSDWINRPPNTLARVEHMHLSALLGRLKRTQSNLWSGRWMALRYFS
jgi:hypothetical protein